MGRVSSVVGTTAAGEGTHLLGQVPAAGHPSGLTWRGRLVVSPQPSQPPPSARPPGTYPARRRSRTIRSAATAASPSSPEVPCRGFCLWLPRRQVAIGYSRKATAIGAARRPIDAMSDVRVSGLTIYPVKSCAGIDVDAVTVTETGFMYDRAWMLVESRKPKPRSDDPSPLPSPAGTDVQTVDDETTPTRRLPSRRSAGRSRGRACS